MTIVICYITRCTISYRIPLRSPEASWRPGGVGKSAGVSEVVILIVVVLVVVVVVVVVEVAACGHFLIWRFSILFA